MAGGDHLFLDMRCLLVREHQGIVGERIELDVEHPLRLRQRIAHRAVDLRDATQRIAVLRLVLLAATERQEAQVELLAAMALAERHPVPADVEAQRLRGGSIPARRQPLPETRHQVIGDVGQRGAIEQAQQVVGGLHLARVRTQCVDFRCERTKPAGEGIDRHRCGEIRGVQQVFELLHGQHAGGEHLRGAVVQRQAFLVGQRDRLQALATQGLGAGNTLAVDEGFPAPEQHDGEMRQRREVTGCTHRTELRHHRHDPGIEQRRQRLQGLHADAGMPAQERVDADAQHRPHHVRRERFAHAHRVGDDQVALQFDMRRLPGPRRTWQFVAQRMRA